NSLPDVAHSASIHQQTAVRPAKHIDDARSDRHAFRVDYCFSLHSSKTSNRRYGITAQSDIAAEGWSSRPVIDCSVSNDDIKFFLRLLTFFQLPLCACQDDK